MILAADLLSLLRVLLTGGVMLFSLSGSWVLAFITLVFAWLTDLADGAAARKWGSLRLSMPKLDSDGIADSVLAFGSSAVPVIYAWFHAPGHVSLVLTMLYLVSVVLGVLMAMGMGNLESPKTQRLIKVNMPLFHGVLQIGATTMWFAYMAFGAFGTVLVLVAMYFVAVKQMPKVQRWFAGRL